MKTTINPLTKLLLIASAFCAFHQADAALLTYWNFNNDSPGYLSGNGTLGSFNTSAAAYGEAYTQVNNSTPGTLASNTLNSTVFNGSSIKMDFTNLGTAATPMINGKTAASSYTVNGQTSTSFGGYGTFLDSTLNRVAGDATTGGSFIIMNPSGTEQGKYVTLSLSSAGYSSLQLSFATRSSSGTASQAWTYSLNNITYFNLTTFSTTVDGNFHIHTLDFTTLIGSALDDKASFYLRVSPNSGNTSSYAFDNIQLTGTAIPEPSTWALLAFSLTTVVVLRRRLKA